MEIMRPPQPPIDIYADGPVPHGQPVNHYVGEDYVQPTNEQLGELAASEARARLADVVGGAVVGAVVEETTAVVEPAAETTPMAVSAEQVKAVEFLLPQQEDIRQSVAARVNDKLAERGGKQPRAAVAGMIVGEAAYALYESGKGGDESSQAIVERVLDVAGQVGFVSPYHKGLDRARREGRIQPDEYEAGVVAEFMKMAVLDPKRIATQKPEVREAANQVLADMLGIEADEVPRRVQDIGMALKRRYYSAEQMVVVEQRNTQYWAMIQSVLKAETDARDDLAAKRKERRRKKKERGDNHRAPSSNGPDQLDIAA